jgi:hypothetical protein
MESTISALVCSTTSNGIAAAATLSTLQAICCTKVAGKSVLAMDHVRAVHRVGLSRNLLSPNHGLYTKTIFSIGFVKHQIAIATGRRQHGTGKNLPTRSRTLCHNPGSDIFVAAETQAARSSAPGNPHAAV